MESKLKLIKNAIVQLKNGESRLFDVIKITNQGVIFGHMEKILNNDYKKGDSNSDGDSNILNTKFIEGGFIPIQNIKKIIESKNNFKMSKKNR